MNLARVSVVSIGALVFLTAAILADTPGASLLPGTVPDGIVLSWQGSLAVGEEKRVTVRVFDEASTVLKWVGDLRVRTVRFIVQQSIPSATQTVVATTESPKTWSVDAGFFEQIHVVLSWDDGWVGTTTIVPTASLSRILICREGLVSDSILYGLSIDTASLGGADPRAAEHTLPKGQAFLVEADPVAGFHFPYYLFVPTFVPTDKPVHLLVETNNTGTPRDDFAIHLLAAKTLAGRSYLNSLARRLATPLLVPVFPRPGSLSALKEIDPQSLERDVLLVRDGELARIDLQLVAMIEHARKKLRQDGVVTHDAILMNGFSASGVFANRFAVLHPAAVHAVAAGGVCGLPILPVAAWNGHALPYPIGISDVGEITGVPFDIDAYCLVRQYLYMGSDDKTDAVLFPDAWTAGEAELIREAIGDRMLPDRWETSQSVYRAAGVPAAFATYSGVGHSITNSILDDVAAFLRAQVHSGD